MRALSGLAGPDVAKAFDGVEGVSEGDAVCEHADVLLEELDGTLRVGPIVAIGLATGEAEDVERVLQTADIVAVEVGETQVEGAITHLVALVDEDGPAGQVNFSRDGQAVFDAEASHGVCGGRAKLGCGALRLVDLVVKRCQAILDVLDHRAGHALANRIHQSTPCVPARPPGERRASRYLVGPVGPVLACG